MTLFDDRGQVHRGDPWTSHAAARSVKRGTQRWRVLLELGVAGSDGMTDWEIGAELNIRETSAGTRRKELERLGLVERTTRHRPTGYGNQALVHVITDAGYEAIRAVVDASENPAAS